MTAPIYEAALELQSMCRSLDWSFCFIGGIAVQRWGELRYTQDVDITLQTGFGNEAAFVDVILERFESRIPSAAEFARRSRVVLVRATNGIPIDIALGAVPFEVRAVKRATDHAYDDGVVLRTCSAEDLVIFKAFAGRDRDWADIRGIVMRHGPELDDELIWEELTPLLELKKAPEDMSKLRTILGDPRAS